MPPKVRKAKGLRTRIMAARGGETDPEKARKRGAQMRADAVVEDYLERKAELMPGEPVSVGGVTFVDVRPFGEGGVEVFTAPDQVESHYRLFNPPTLARDGQGDIEIRGRKHVEDPLAAVAAVILTHRRQQQQKRRFR